MLKARRKRQKGPIAACHSPALRLKKRPRSLDEWLLLPEEFGSAEHLIWSIHSAADAAETAQQVQTFCTQHGLSRKTGSHTGLCLEELAENIVRFGFRADKKRHDIEVRVVLKKEAVILRIKDDCIPFNPQEWYEMTTPAGNPTKNVGIRLVFGIARHIEYQNMLGLNVLTVILD